MAKDCPAMEDLSVGAGEEIELSLGLSIGGNSRKSPKLNPEEQRTANAGEDPDPENRNCSEFMDPQRKREVHAFKRQEARRKRDEKLRKRGLVTAGSGFWEDDMGVEAQRVQIRARDREMRENEAKVEGRECDKREKNEERGDNNNGAQNLSQGTVPPVVPYPPLQFVPLADGFVYPCVVPCLAPTVTSGGSEKNEGNVLRPVACRSFWPGQGGLRPGGLVTSGSDCDYNGGKDGGNRIAESNGSPVFGSSVASDNQSSSQQGGSSSSDTGSHSSHCKPDQSQLKYSCEHGVPSSQTETTHANCKTTKNTNRAVPSRAIKSSPTKLMEQTDSETHPNAEDKPLTSQNSNPGSMKVASDQRLDAPSLSQMPCVSTTGNGPNGKTITGFLYRYTKTEVSIVCVCHGSSFSPAEFVEHAGGKDITHPLRHITVIPSAFG
ncbi:hypothetical protein RHSIM_Rhsim01G0251800 [Rhododendron simsii]|uniref:Ninja-family protein n=1 Tax=Rhododendron simsii TaxID=118357 RepID=A0A834HHR0_RHOSS|nr:hypothetical protein RHSIM_Rhsim01G0251800 [Rhododendron simsii]